MTSRNLWLNFTMPRVTPTFMDKRTLLASNRVIRYSHWQIQTRKEWCIDYIHLRFHTYIQSAILGPHLQMMGCYNPVYTMPRSGPLSSGEIYYHAVIYIE